MGINASINRTFYENFRGLKNGGGINLLGFSFMKSRGELDGAFVKASTKTFLSYLFAGVGAGGYFPLGNKMVHELLVCVTRQSQ